MYTSMMPRSTKQVLKTTTLKKSKSHKNKRLLSSKQRHRRNASFTTVSDMSPPKNLIVQF